MNPEQPPPSDASSRQRLLEQERNWLALALSVVPGLGQLYKGYKAMGILIMIVGVPAVIWAAALLFLATFGIGLILIPIAWAMVALHAFVAEDHRRHHIGVL